MKRGVTLPADPQPSKRPRSASEAPWIGENAAQVTIDALEGSWEVIGFHWDSATMWELWRHSVRSSGKGTLTMNDLLGEAHFEFRRAAQVARRLSGARVFCSTSWPLRTGGPGGGIRKLNSGGRHRRLLPAIAHDLSAAQPFSGSRNERSEAFCGVLRLSCRRACRG